MQAGLGDDGVGARHLAYWEGAWLAAGPAIAPHKGMDAEAVTDRAGSKAIPC